MIKYMCITLVAVGSLLADGGIPSKLGAPDKPSTGVYTGCRSTLDVNWKNFPRFEWCVDYFVANPKEALKNTNFVKKASEWMEFIKARVIEQVKSDKKLSAEVKAHDSEAKDSDESEDLAKVEFVPISEIEVSDTMRRAQNMIAGTVKVLEEFQKAAKSDKSLAEKIGKVAMAGISGTLKLGNDLCTGLGSMAQVAKPKSLRAPDFSVGLNILFNLMK